MVDGLKESSDEIASLKKAFEKINIQINSVIFNCKQLFYQKEKLKIDLKNSKEEKKAISRVYNWLEEKSNLAKKKKVKNTGKSLTKKQKLFILLTTIKNLQKKNEDKEISHIVEVTKLKRQIP